MDLHLSRKEYQRRRLRKARLRKRLNRRGYTGGFVQNEGKGISAKDCLSNGIKTKAYYLFLEESSLPCCSFFFWLWKELPHSMIPSAAAFSASFQIAPSVQVKSLQIEKISNTFRRKRRICKSHKLFNSVLWLFWGQKISSQSSMIISINRRYRAVKLIKASKVELYFANIK